MRAMPYCRLRPSAIRPYMPPTTMPLSTTSNRITRALPPTGATSPLRLRERQRLGAALVRRQHADYLAVLPLADGPGILLHLVLELEHVEHRVEAAFGDRVADLFAIDLAHF